MLEKSQEFPRRSSVEAFLARLLHEKGDKVRSVVLFGSAARGEHTTYSDLDVFIIVREEKLSFVERLSDYSIFSDGYVEPVVYTVDEVERMLGELRAFLLDVMRDGKVLYDDGYWRIMIGRFNELLDQGVIKPKPNGWIISEARSPEAG